MGDLTFSTHAFVRIDLWDRTIELTASDAARHPDRYSAGVEGVHEIPAHLPSRELANAIESVFDTVEQIHYDGDDGLESPTDEPDQTLLEEIAIEFETL